MCWSDTEKPGAGETILFSNNSQGVFQMLEPQTVPTMFSVKYIPTRRSSLEYSTNEVAFWWLPVDWVLASLNFAIREMVGQWYWELHPILVYISTMNSVLKDGTAIWRHMSSKTTFSDMKDPCITIYSSPSILQPSILRPPLIIRPLDLVPNGNFLC